MRDWMVGSILFTGFGFLLFFLVSLPLAKLQLCQVYYPELNTWLCMISNYGLPDRGRSRKD